MSDVLVKVEGVRKKFCRSLKKSLWYGLKDMSTEVLGGKGKHDALRDGEFWAVNDVSFELKRGECLGLVGRNGAGKTTLLKMLNGLIKPDHGRIEMRGRVGALIALGAGFNPILTGRENIYVNGSVLGLTKKEIDAKIDEIIDFAEIREFIDSPVQSYSSGMQVRLGFSVAVTLLLPDILILDEVLAVGDSAFRAKCEKKISELMTISAVIFVSHEASHIRKLCNKVVWLERGHLKAMGETKEILPEYGKNQEHVRIASAKTTIDAISSLELHVLKPRIKFGTPLHISFKIISISPVHIELVCVDIMDGDSPVAQTIIRNSLVINGCHTVTIETDSLCLRNGRYTLNLSMYGRTYKDFVLRYTTLGEIESHEGGEGWSYYHFPARVHIVG